MKKGEIIYARTNAEFLNALINKNYKQWYKCTYELNNDTFIWMICLNNSNNVGHRNKFENDCTIIEQFDTSLPKNKRFNHGLERPFRLVFEKIKTANGCAYKFHGLFKLVTPVIDEYKRTLKSVNDDYNF